MADPCKLDLRCNSGCFDCPEFEAALSAVTDEEEAKAKQAELDRVLL